MIVFRLDSAVLRLQLQKMRWPLILSVIVLSIHSAVADGTNLPHIVLFLADFDLNGPTADPPVARPPGRPCTRG